MSFTVTFGPWLVPIVVWLFVWVLVWDCEEIFGFPEAFVFAVVPVILALLVRFLP